MTEKRLCPKCGAELSPDAAQGMCPKCLLDAGFESPAAGDEREDTSNEPKTPEMAAAETLPPDDSPSDSFATPQLESLARQFPQLDNLEFLGRGGMGVVYKARQRQLNRMVAVKILTQRLADDPAFAERFMREAQALARLTHSNIVQVYDFGQTDEFFYFVMEFVDGVNLRALIHDGKLNPEEALKIVPQICEALQFAHDEGIVHRDIKPANILVDKKGRVKIADFGIAKLLGLEPEDVSLTGTGQLMGTLGYMAPEQLQQAHAVDHRADIFSLGVVFYEMLTGQLPTGRFEPPSKNVQLDVRLDEVVLRSLESEPTKRYQHASDVKTDVEAISSSANRQSVNPATQLRTADEEEQDNGGDVDAIDAAQERVQWPGIGLLVVGIFSSIIALIAWSSSVIATSTDETAATEATSRASTVANAMLPIIVALSLAILLGALKMLRLRSHRWAIAASVVALLPLPAGALWILSLPIGIWSLVVLNRPVVKRGFASRKQWLAREQLKHR